MSLNNIKYSNYIGVSIVNLKNRVKYQASIYHNGININLYYGDSDIDAAIAYDNYVINNKLNRKLNFQNEIYLQ